MKVFVALIVFFGVICDLNEACSPRTRRRGNPKIIRTLPPVTEVVEQATEAPTEKARTTRAVAEQTTEVAGAEVNTEAPTAKVPTEAAPTEPKAVEATTAELVEPLTRPTSVHRFFKRPAVVSSTKDERTCADVSGSCKAECQISTEYLMGRFQCPFGTNCCGKR